MNSLDLMVSKPSYSGLQDEGLQTVCLRCRLFLQCQDLSPGDCRPVVKPVYLVLEPTSRGLLIRMQPVYMVSGPIYNVGMCCIAKAVFVLATYNAPTTMFLPLCVR